MFNKYYERGFSVIPIRPSSKAPVAEAEGYQNWSFERQPPELIERWDSIYKLQDGYGVGIIMGPISNLCFVDIDTLDPDIIAACPVSPVVRRGDPSRYGALLFKYSPGISNKPHKIKMSETENHGVDIFFERKYLLMPPSPHILGGNYEWLTPDTLDNFDANDLPTLTQAQVDRVTARFEAMKMGLSPSMKSQPFAGRNDYLKSVVWAKRLAGETEEDIIEAVYQIDCAKHSIPLFSDPSERNQAANIDQAKFNAWKFVNSVTKSFIERSAGPAPRIRPLIIGSGKPRAESWKEKPLPEPSGLIKDIRDLILGWSVNHQPTIAMSGAVSIASVLVANRFRMGETWPNIYSLLIARTGSGKSFPMNAALRLLAIENETGLFGKETVLSGQALIKGIDAQRERLDVVDECSNLFQMITKGGVFQNDILPLLLKLYTQSSSLFIGPESKGQDPIRVFHPCVSSLMMTNPDDFVLSVTKNFITGGFIPRFLPFVEWRYGDMQPHHAWNKELASKISNQINTILSIPIDYESPEGVKRNLMMSRPFPRDVQVTEGAKKLFTAFFEESNAAIKNEETPEMHRHMLTRAPQNVDKLALIHGVLTRGFVDEKDARWAVDMVYALIHNAEPLMNRISASTPAEAALIGVWEVIKKSGSISLSKLYEQTRILTKSQRNDALDALQIEGKIKPFSDQNGKGYAALI